MTDHDELLVMCSWQTWQQVKGDAGRTLYEIDDPSQMFNKYPLSVSKTCETHAPDGAECYTHRLLCLAADA